jgi:dihydrofolate synthase / folylpolyglutamate synthase
VTYAETIDYLYSLRVFGAKFGLSNTLKLADLSGNPHQKLRFIHVAGTNGKGSTCAMLDSIYRAAGLRVGLFTSPHLVAFGERIQVNRQNISEADIVRQVTEMKPLLAQFSEDHHPTFFEVVTVMALRYFAEQHCDLVIWETGLGGRLDATNIVTPLASVITNIQFDHQKWLGFTLPEIAREKAGIIKPRVPVITATDEPAALEVIEAVAKQNESPLAIVTKADATKPPLDRVKLSLTGEHQRLNAAVAVATVRAVNSLPVPEKTIVDGLSTVQWPGRLQLLKRPAGGEVLLDGAHNIAGANALRDALAKNFEKRKITLVLGILADKDWREICQLLAPTAERIILVSVNTDRTASAQELAEVCAAANERAGVEVQSSISDALAATATSDLTVVTGSLYLVGEALEALGWKQSTGRSEVALNQWR